MRLQSLLLVAVLCAVGCSTQSAQRCEQGEPSRATPTDVGSADGAPHYMVVVAGHRAWTMTFDDPSGDGMAKVPSTHAKWKAALVRWYRTLAPRARVTTIRYDEGGLVILSDFAPSTQAAADLARAHPREMTDVMAPHLWRVVWEAASRAEQAKGPLTLVVVTDGKACCAPPRQVQWDVRRTASHLLRARTRVAAVFFSEDAQEPFAELWELARRVGGAATVVPPDQGSETFFFESLKKTVASAATPSLPQNEQEAALGVVLSTSESQVDGLQRLESAVLKGLRGRSELLRSFAESGAATPWLPARGIAWSRRPMSLGSDAFRGASLLQWITEYVGTEPRAVVPARRALLWVHVGRGADIGPADAKPVVEAAKKTGVRLCIVHLRPDGDTGSSAGYEALAKGSAGTYASFPLKEAQAKPDVLIQAAGGLCGRLR